MSDELKSCPFCGCCVVSNGYHCEPGRDDGVWIVECFECQSDGPSGDTEDDAIAAWNKRVVGKSALWSGLDHIANFMNALDTEGMSTKQVRSAIYAECINPITHHTPKGNPDE